MFQLSVRDIHPGEQAGNKEAIRRSPLRSCRSWQRGDDFVNGMLATTDLHLPRQRYLRSRHHRHPRSGAENRCRSSVPRSVLMRAAVRW